MKSFSWFSCILAALFILFTGIASAVVPASQNASNENTLLQFTAGGHILGFKPDKVYFASFDHAITEEFVGTNGVMPIGEAGKGKTEDIKGAPQLGKVIYNDLWKGITLQYESRNGGIAESTYLLEPEADVKDIKLKYNVPADIQKDGSLRFRHSSEKEYFSLSAPKAWQEIEGKKIAVEVAFADYGENTIGFRLGQYNRQCPVVIDPTYSWHTFYGSVSSDYGSGIAVDTGGNVYVTGYSNATWNGPGATAPLNAYSGNSDIVVLKLNSAGAYQWHTFYGSVAGVDDGYGIALDTSGNVYVTGYSSSTWNGPGHCATAPLNAHSGGWDDIVVLKLNSAGAYQWHTFYGSVAGVDDGYGIALDTSGNVYVTGYSTATWNGPGATAPLNAYIGSNDIVVLKLFQQSELSDLSITKSDAPDPVTLGNNLTYTITNNEPDGATGVTLTDTLPGVVTFVSAVSTQGSCVESSGVVTCCIGNIANGAAVTVTIVVTPTAPGVISNTATVSSHTSDPNMANNSDTEQTTVIASRTLTVTKAGTGTVAAGAGCTLNWVANTGTCTVNDGTAINLSGSANAGSTWIGWSAGTGSAAGCTGTGNCIFNITQNSGVTATFTLNTYTVTPSAGPNGTINPSTPQTVNYGTTTLVSG